MYFEFQKDIILNENPIFKEANLCFFNYVSLDLVDDTTINKIIFGLYPEKKEMLFSNKINNNFNKGNILPYRKNNYNNTIITAPYKDNFDEPINLDYLEEVIHKFNDNKNKFKFDKVIFFKVQVEKDILEKIINNIKNFPKYEII
tara:strand:- start:89732 stop:90166 length:435 start_codon:yes stop_codon:yes gene_type:complete